MSHEERERYKIPVAVFMMLVKDNEVLMIKRATTGWMDDHYSLPAGSLDPNEDVLSAAIRETKEEVGVDVDKNSVKLVNVMHTKVMEKDWLNLIFLTNEWQGEPKVCEPHKHSEVKWFKINKLPKKIVPYVKVALQDYLNNKNITIYGW